MKTRYIIILTALLLVSYYGFGQDIQTFTLREAQEYALKYSAEVKNTKLDNEIARKKIWETTAIGLPQINGTVNYQHQFVVPELSLGGTPFLQLDPALPAGTPLTSDMVGKTLKLGNTPMAPIKLGLADNTTWDVTLSQLVFNGGYIVGLQAARVYYQIADQNYQKSQIDIKESIANTYSLILIVENNRAVLQLSLDNILKTLAEMRQINKQGLNEDTDVDQIELTSLNITNALNTINRQITASYDLLKFQMGIPLEKKIALTDNLDGLIATVDLVTLAGKQFNIENNITYKIMNTQEAFGKLALRKEISNSLPSIAAFYKHSEMVNQPEFNFTPKDILGLSVTVPIFSSGQRDVMVKQRRLDLEKIKNSKEKAIEGVKLDYTNSKNELTSTFEKYLNEKKNIELTKRIYDKTMIKFREGISSSLDLTQVHNQYLTAQSNFFTAAYNLLTAKNKLDKIINND
jgi:outer membrane protein TolC